VSGAGVAGDFDLALTLECGQVFHWRREGKGWLGVIGEQAVFIEQEGTEEAVLKISRGAEELARHYFALDHPLAEICATFPEDPAMRAASEFCRGMRIVRQPAWECIATFITSSMKQVAHIAQISHTLRRRYGKRVEWDGRELFAYPTPGALARLSEEDLRACALGYRAKNLLGAARMIAEGRLDLEAVTPLGCRELGPRSPIAPSFSVSSGCVPSRLMCGSSGCCAKSIFRANAGSRPRGSGILPPATSAATGATRSNTSFIMPARLGARGSWELIVDC